MVPLVVFFGIASREDIRFLEGELLVASQNEAGLLRDGAGLATVAIVVAGLANSVPEQIVGILALPECKESLCSHREAPFTRRPSSWLERQIIATARATREISGIAIDLGIGSAALLEPTHTAVQQRTL